VSDSVWLATTTRAPIQWPFEYDRRPGVCRLRRIQVSVEATVVRPRWADSSDVDPAAVYWWRSATELTVRHEGEHIRIAVNAAGQIREQLSRLEGVDCGVLAAQANEIGTRIRYMAAEQQQDYDQRTDHGRIWFGRGVP